MKLVIDTNVMLVSVSNKSAIHPIFRSLISNKNTLCISNDILLEYEEIFNRHFGSISANLFLDIIYNLPSLHKIDTFFQWNLISADLDDNKFVDCAVATGCDYLISDDKHFRILGDIKFPKVSCISSLDFIEQFALKG